MKCTQSRRHQTIFLVQPNFCCCFHFATIPMLMQLMATQFFLHSMLLALFFCYPLLPYTSHNKPFHCRTICQLCTLLLLFVRAFHFHEHVFDPYTGLEIDCYWLHWRILVYGKCESSFFIACCVCAWACGCVLLLHNDKNKSHGNLKSAISFVLFCRVHENLMIES